MDEANKKAVMGIGAAIVIGSVATAIAYFATTTSDYVAKVDGVRITQEAYDKGVEQVKGSPMGAMQGEEMIKRGVVSQLIDRQLIENEAAKRGISMPDKDLQAKLDEIKRPYGDDEKFEKVLEANHLTLAELKDRIRFGYLIDAMGKDLTKGQTITDNEVRKYYDAHPQGFKTEEKVRASHILVKDEAKAKDLLKQLQGGADFGKLAKANSLDGSKDQGGDLGFFTRGKMVPEFEQAAFGLKVGQLSGVVKTQFGYHIIKLTDRQPASTQPFDQVKNEARERLTKDREREALEKWLTDARAKAHIEYKEGFAPPTPPKPSVTPPTGHAIPGAGAPAGSAAPAASTAPGKTDPAAGGATPIPTAPASGGESGANTTKGHAPTPGASGH